VVSNDVIVQQSNDCITFPASQSFDVEITSPALDISQNTSELTGSGNAHNNNFVHKPRLDHNRTLLIGDSILKGISKRGLQRNVDVRTLPGKKSRDIYTRLLTEDTSKYTTIVMMSEVMMQLPAEHHAVCMKRFTQQLRLYVTGAMYIYALSVRERTRTSGR